MQTNKNAGDYLEFYNNLISGNYNKCSDFIFLLLKNEIEIKELYEKVIKKSLYKVGTSWEENKISISTEHVASSIVETILNDVYQEIRPNKLTKKTVILACAENEFHQIGLKMVRDIFEINGWYVNFLGNNTTLQKLDEFIEKKHPNLLAFSLSIPFNFPSLEKMIKALKIKYPQLPILIGGQAFLHINAHDFSNSNNLIYKTDLMTLDFFLKSETNF